MTTLFIIAMFAAGLVQDHQHADVTRRGEAVMGFDQSTTTHHFLIKPAGGEIAVTANDAKDTASIGQIRMHLQHIAKAFATGDFTAPMLIHAKEPPGVKTMKQAGSEITYAFEKIERGGVLTITTASPAARDAVHEFLRFQIKDHKTGDSVRD